MKKLIIGGLLFFSLFSAAQDSTQVVLSSQVAKKIILDLTKGDYCEKELKETQKLVGQLENKVELQKTIIETKDKTEDLWEKINGEQEKELKKEKRKSVGLKILLYVSLGLNVVLAVKSL